MTHNISNVTGLAYATSSAASLVGIFEFYRATMADGRSYAFPENQTLEEARP
ncbi:hypothetical protein NHF46_01805 [Arthrobacter alpinus]|nr:hypothetical protein [Arthrobacter alpinus]